MNIEFKDIASKYSEHLDSLYHYAINMGFKEQEVMDAVHDVFYKLCIQHSSLAEINNLKTYLYKSLRNRLIDIHKTKKEFLGISNYSIDEENHHSLPFQLSISGEDELIEKEDSEEIIATIENFLNTLSDRQREIVYLRFIRECSYEDIAEIMNITVASARNLISKSLNKIKNSVVSINLLVSLII